MKQPGCKFTGTPPGDNEQEKAAWDETGRFRWWSSMTASAQMTRLYDRVESRDHDHPEFLQAFREVLFTLAPLFNRCPKYLAVMETIVEPERSIQFRVPWIDDEGRQRINRGFRVQFSSALGPFKGGLRFHPNVDMGVIKFLAFEETFKNALTGLPLGGAEGGADFNPKGKSDGEIMRFCQSFMTSLERHVGPDLDISCGDMGVDLREIGYLFGQYKRMTSRFEGAVTGKDPAWGGSFIGTEATGYGIVYFANCWLQDEPDAAFHGKRVLVSGSGKVAQSVVEKLLEFGAVPLTMSDSTGFIHEPGGFTKKKLEAMKELKNSRRGRISEFCQLSSTAVFVEGQKPWGILCDIAIPCATQNEITANDAGNLALGGCRAVIEGANMPTTNKAIDVLKEQGISLCPSKAASAGGVIISGLDMSQNSVRLPSTREDVDAKLKVGMKSIYHECVHAADVYGTAGDLEVGANIAAFLKVANAVIQQGCV